MQSHFFRFNLSTYPFLNSVPDNDDIDFKCDGLHDGFYASIKYSCQVCVLFLLFLAKNGSFANNCRPFFCCCCCSFIIIVCTEYVMTSCVPILPHLIRNHSSVTLSQKWIANRRPNTGSGSLILFFIFFFSTGPIEMHFALKCLFCRNDALYKATTTTSTTTTTVAPPPTTSHAPERPFRRPGRRPYAGRRPQHEYYYDDEDYDDDYIEERMKSRFESK